MRKRAAFERCLKDAEHLQVTLNSMSGPVRGLIEVILFSVFFSRFLEVKLCDRHLTLLDQEF